MPRKKSIKVEEKTQEKAQATQASSKGSLGSATGQELTSSSSTEIEE